MNIFKYEGKEFDKKIDEIFKDIKKEELKKELVKCGLVLNKDIILKGEYTQKMLYNINYDYNTYDIHKNRTSNNIFINLVTNLSKKNKKEMEEVA